MKSAKLISEHDIPVIDIGPLHKNGDLKTVGEQLVWAATEVGFIYIKNHGIPEDLIASTRSAGAQFFKLGDAEKTEVQSNQYHHGYLKVGATKMHDDAKTDLKESFVWGIELDENALQQEVSNPMLGPNQWPTAMQSLKASIYPYFEAASETAKLILRGFAVGSSLPAEFFLKHNDRPVSRGSMQYYPPQNKNEGEPRFGVSPHTDFGVLTVLHQDAIGGLELQLMNGEWRAVPPIDGTLVINVGDLLERWSNGRFRSTPHRVINNSGRERLSLAIAYDPNFETLVESRTFCDKDDTPKWDDITVGDYLMWRFNKAFAYRTQ